MSLSCSSLAPRRKIGPGIPHGAEQPPLDAVALGGEQERAERRAFLERRAAVRFLAKGTLVKGLADLVGPGGEHLVEQAGVERARARSR